MKIFALAVSTIFFFASCSNKYGITKASAFVRKSIAGTVRVDENGRQLNSGIAEQHLLFVETDSSKTLPQWETAWIKQQPYSIQPIEIKQAQQIIGKTNDEKEVMLRRKKGHQLWQLVLMPLGEREINDPSLKTEIDENNIVVTGTWKNKPFGYVISKEEQLQPLQFQ